MSKSNPKISIDLSKLYAIVFFHVILLDKVSFISAGPNIVVCFNEKLLSMVCCVIQIQVSKWLGRLAWPHYWSTLKHRHLNVVFWQKILFHKTLVDISFKNLLIQALLLQRGSLITWYLILHSFFKPKTVLNFYHQFFFKD